MVEMIGFKDLPISTRPSEAGSRDLSKDTTILISPPPGASAVRHIPNRGTEWYCQTCTAFIRPIWIRQGKTVYPACRECFFDDLPTSNADLGVAREVKNVALLTEAPTI